MYFVSSMMHSDIVSPQGERGSTLRTPYRQFLPLILIFLLLCPDVVLGAVLIDRIAAVVNQEVITQSDLSTPAGGASPAGGATLPGALPPAKGEAVAVPTASFETPLRVRSEERLLKQAIESRLIFQTAQRLGVRLTDLEFERALKEIETRNQFQNRALFRQAVESSSLSWDRYLADLKAELTLIKLVGREIDPDLFVTFDETKAYYERFLEKFQADQIELKQILFRRPSTGSNGFAEETRKRAEQVRLDIEKGIPFDQMVERYSEGLERRQGGSLGVFQRGGLQSDLEQMLFGLRAGEVSPVIKTQTGFHIFKVTRKITGPPLSFEEVRPKISTLLLKEKRETLTRLWFNKVLKQTFIEIK